MRFLAPCIFGLLFAWAVGSIAADKIAGAFQNDAALFKVATP